LEGFARAIERAKAHVYKATGRFMPNWIKNLEFCC